MARIRLYLKPSKGNTNFLFIRAGGIHESVPSLRVFVYVNLMASVRPGSREAGEAAFPDCIIDTGSPISIVPEYIWSHFHPGIVIPLPFDPAMPQIQRSVSLSGGRYPYELGELTIQLRDLERRTMDVRIVAQFTRDGGVLTLPMILGLRGGAIDDRILRSEPDANALFGQSWFLEDP